VQVDRRGLGTALVAGFLAVGTRSGVRDAIDADSGAKGTGSLAGDKKASAARDGLPDKRLADVYLSQDGIAELVANPRGPLSTLATVINPDASQGAAATSRTTACRSTSATGCTSRTTRSTSRSARRCTPSK